MFHRQSFAQVNIAMVFITHLYESETVQLRPRSNPLLLCCRSFSSNVTPELGMATSPSFTDMCTVLEGNAYSQGTESSCSPSASSFWTRLFAPPPLSHCSPEHATICQRQQISTSTRTYSSACTMEMALRTYSLPFCELSSKLGSAHGLLRHVVPTS